MGDDMAEMTLEQQVARLTAIEDIKQMKAQYCSYADHGYDPEGMASLFVEDAIWDGGDFGRYEGVAAIKEFFAGISNDIVFAIHPVMNPIIKVDGDTANAKWWLIMWCTMKIDGNKEARWFAAEYDDHLVKRDGKWLFTHITVQGRFLATHGEGWAEQTG
jgi:hypothetical protein